MTTLASLAADAVLVVHLLFILLVIFGGLLVLRRPRWAWLHLPALVWGIWITATRGVCPLTPLESMLRQRAGEAPYGAGGFLGHYVSALVYPEGLAFAPQFWVAVLLAASNALLYGWAILRRRRKKMSA